jgi:hypothetical protein
MNCLLTICRFSHLFTFNTRSAIFRPKSSDKPEKKNLFTTVRKFGFHEKTVVHCYRTGFAEKHGKWLVWVVF